MASAAFSFTGSAGSLLRLDASAATSVVATLDDLSGVTSVVWSVAGTDETGGTYTLVASGPSGSICTFTSGAAGTAGLLQCTINGGVNPATGDVDATMTKKAKWQVKTAAGYDVAVVGEELEHDPTYGYTVVVNNIARNMVAGGGSTFVDSAFRITGSSDATKRIAFEADTSITTGTTRTATMPDKNGTLAMTSDILGPTFADNVFRITGSADSSKLAAFEVDGFTTATTRTFTLPNATGTLMLTSDIGALDDSVFALQDNADATKQLAFQCSGITTGNKRTLTAPDADGTITCDATTSTLTNKTYDTAGAGNVFRINGTGITAVTGTGAVVLASSPTLTTPALGVATATSVNGLTITSSTGTVTITNGTTFASNVSGPATGQFLRYNGSAWANVAAPSIVDAHWIKESVDAAAGTATAAIRFFTAPEATTITDAYAAPRGAAASDATDYASVIIERWNSAGVSQGVVATGSTTPSSSGAMVNLGKWSLGALTNATMAAGDYLTVAITKSGAGRQLPRFQVYCARTAQV